MAGETDRWEERRFDTRDQNGLCLARQRKARGIGLKLRGLLALGQERAGRDTVVIVEDVMDEMRGKGNQVGGEEARRQGTQEPTQQATHWGGMVPDFLVYATIQSVQMFPVAVPG